MGVIFLLGVRKGLREPQLFANCFSKNKKSPYFPKWVLMRIPIKKMDKELFWVKVRYKLFFIQAVPIPARLFFLHSMFSVWIYAGLIGSHRARARIWTQVFLRTKSRLLRLFKFNMLPFKQITTFYKFISVSSTSIYQILLKMKIPFRTKRIMMRFQLKSWDN